MSGGGHPRRSRPPARGRHHDDSDRVSRQHASTFLTHFFGSGLADERYVVERFKALAWIPTLRQGARPMCSSGPRDLRLDHLVWLGFRIVQPQPIIPVKQRDFDRVVVVSIAEKHGGHIVSAEPQFLDHLAQMVDRRPMRLGGEKLIHNNSSVSSIFRQTLHPEKACDKNRRIAIHPPMPERPCPLPPDPGRPRVLPYLP